ncbi:MAG: NAD-dependent protein deacylase [Lachnospiraceae bacterium]|nr:NAD-dependent protein deacylase [Lachnospiraceae bacterium]
MKHLGKFSDRRKESAYLRSLKGEEKYEALNEIIEQSKHIAFFGGAGVSTESGIPDFRSKDGLYNQHDVRFDRYQPEYLLSSSCLYHEPKVFFEFYRQKMDARHCLPNRAHVKLAQMEEKGKLDGIITQNIDGLHQKAGSRTVYEVHGSTLRNYCDRCGKKYPESYIYDSSEAVPHCTCGGMIRPDVTLYGESLPVAAWEGAERLIQKADCLIVGGTSLTVYPAASLVRYYSGGYLIIVNRDHTGQEDWADLTFNESIGEVFSHINI